MRCKTVTSSNFGSMSKYQAIIFDLDGTAVPNSPGGMPSRRLIEAVATYQSTVHLIAATGRPIDAATPVIDALGLITPSIVSGGTVILEAKTHRILKRTPLPRAAVNEIFTIAKTGSYHLHLRDELVHTEAESLHPSIGENVEIIYVTSIPTADIPHLLAIIGAIQDVAVSAVPDWMGAGSILNITHKNATKEHAVAEILAQFEVPQAAAIGVGDGDNDLHLFKSVGFKVAMGNASPALKSAADFIAPPIDQDGLAEIIERYAA